MRIAIVGCGYVADFYLWTLGSYRQLEILGVMDRDRSRAARLAGPYGLMVYETLESILRDPRVDIVVNLTNPGSHYAVTRAALDAGKHVYSEKPLATDLGEARALVSLAEERGLYLGAAPSTMLGEAAQTLWKAVRAGRIGRVKLAYAELDDGYIPGMTYGRWLSDSGHPWPAEDEFSTGCTLEHAGYALSWLLAILGPARAVHAYSACVVPGKTDRPCESPETPDFSVACIEFASGAIARLTNSIVADRSHELRLFGDKGSLRVESLWELGSRLWLRRKSENGYAEAPEPYPLVRTPVWEGYGREVLNSIDFGRGVAELAAAVTGDRRCRLGARFSLHLTEITLAIQNAGRNSGRIPIESTFDPVEPMPWAMGD